MIEMQHALNWELRLDKITVCEIEKVGCKNRENEVFGHPAHLSR